MIEAHVYDVAAGAGLGDWFEHEGEDLLVVLEGAVHVEFGDGQHVDLATGDVLWHVSTRGPPLDVGRGGPPAARQRPPGARRAARTAA